MRPADERLQALDAARRHFHDGQVVHAELLAYQGPAQVCLQVEQLRRPLAHGGVEHHRPRAALCLGPVHGGVRVEEQILRPRVGRRGERDPEAGGGEDLVARDGERLRGDLMDAVRHHRRVVRLAHVVEQDGELVSSLPRQRVALAEAGVQPGGHLHQELVPGGVAQAVVHGLEPIEVEEQHGEAVPFAPPRAGEGALHQVEKQGAVGQARERVVERVVQHAVGDRLALRDVHQRAGQADRLAAPVLHRRAARQHPSPRSLPVEEPVLVLEPLAAPFHVRREGGLEVLAIGWVDPVGPRRRVVAELREAAGPSPRHRRRMPRAPARTDRAPRAAPAPAPPGPRRCRGGRAAAPASTRRSTRRPRVSPRGGASAGGRPARSARSARRAPRSDPPREGPAQPDRARPPAGRGIRAAARLPRSRK